VPPAAAGKRARHDQGDDVTTVGAATMLSKITDPHKLSQRQKQIDMGKNTIAYERYAQDVKKRERTRELPHTPDIAEPDSKRQFDGRVREWRRRLHKWEQDNPLQVPSSAAAKAAVPLEPAPAVALAPAVAVPAATVSSEPLSAHPLEARASTAERRAAVEAEMEKCLAAPNAGYTKADSAEMDAYLDGFDSDADSEGDAEDAAGVTPAQPIPSLSAGNVSGSSAATQCGSGSSAQGVGAHAPPRRPAAASIFADASTIDDGLVG